MFGERYFATRERLAEVVLGVGQLGRECGEEILDAATDGTFLKDLRKPFLFVVCGEVNAGKSALINALFGSEFCEVDALPKTNRLHWYRHGEKASSTERRPLLVERLLPLGFLRDFEVVDTPGSDARIDGNLGEIERFLPVADLLFFVFPVANPWCAATWQLVARLPEEQLDKVAFVLQQSDLKDEDDLEVILGHMKTLGEQKTGRIPEIFPVSAKRAMEAKKADPPLSHVLQKSGLPPLDYFISSKISSNPQRRKILREVSKSTQGVLKKIEGLIEERIDSLDSDQRFLAELENEVDLRREGQATALSERLSGLGDVFFRQGQMATRDLGRRMALIQSLISLFQQEKLPSEIEKNLTEAVKEAVEKQAEIDGVELVQSCRNHWETVEPRIRENLNMNPPNFQQETESLGGTRKRFMRRLGRSAKQAVAQLKIRGTLDLQMDIRRMVLRRYMALFLALFTIAGILGGLGVTTWPWVVMTMAAGILGIAAIYSKRSRKALCHDFMERIEDLRQPFADSLADDYKDGVREFYLEYGGLFEIVRRRIADQKLLLEPRKERWNDLFLELKAIDQEL
ncbi:50S ribosome-binding GTPase [bacterium]|nr:50S ribosome-binding GTPase [Akkermansiaceae bacterium]MDB4488648.1 50S ribosome-binding GTPase [Akkermansiaceae bacterium]MDB4526660.1 50S ribosome-binding GTPase [bacterium]